MKLIDAFEAEHRLIDQVLGAFRTYVDRRVDGAAGAVEVADGARFVAFFAGFVGGYHVEREERVFFEALVTRAELPAERGPVFAITHEHAELDAWLQEMVPLLGPQASAQERLRLRELAVRYTRALWQHLDAENSVLYTEGALRLGRYGVQELPDRPRSEAEAAARADGAALLAIYPPREDEALARGDGCYLCRAHGRSCDGLEAEWWSELEWDEFFER